jgi:four helix bundle protein
LTIRSYRDLKVWQLAMDLVQVVYGLTGALPKAELYGLVSQMRRSAISVPSNIAEGHARSSTKEYIRFLSIALASLAELETQMLISKRLDYISDMQLREALRRSDVLGKMVRALERSLDARRSR